jgi:hypothetical protein
MEKGDEALYVEFYVRNVINQYKTDQAGREITEPHDFIRITVPGNQTFNIDTFANERYQKRFPIQWAAYKAGISAKEQAEQTGTSIDLWPFLSAEQKDALRKERFFTVELIAEAADAVMASKAMVFGIDGFVLRDRAKAFLRVASDSAALFNQQQEAERLRKEMAERDAKYAADMAEMRAQIEAMRPKMGRPPKEREAA